MEVSVKVGNWEISGRVTGGWEGDPDVPNGTRWIWTVEELEVWDDDGVQPTLTEEEIEECEIALIQEFRTR